MPETDAVIRKYALQNALLHDGTANPGSVIGKVLNELPELKASMKEVVPRIREIAQEITSMTTDAQRAELEKLAPELLEKKKKEKDRSLPDIPLDGREVVFRFEPSPSGPLHIGHAYVFLLNFGLAEENGGRVVLRIADTNPENIYPPAYDLIPEDAAWLSSGVVTKAVIQSDRVEVYHRYGQEFIEKDLAYVCTCEPDFARKLRHASESCPCRALTPEENLKRWQRMFDGFSPGEAVVRVKTDLSDPDPALRDWAAFRINDSPHPRIGKKTRVWPLMTLSVAIDDHEDGITHSVRAKEHRHSQRRIQYLYDKLEWKMPHHMYVGRLNFEGLPVSCSKVRPRIESGEFSGWDDVRIPFIAALRRRGFQPGAFLRYAMEVGMSETDKTITGDDYFKLLNNFNKELIEPGARRFFFVWNPTEIVITGVETLKGRAPLLPDRPEEGFREVELLAENGVIRLFISSDDVGQWAPNEKLRLKDLGNIQVTGPGVAKYVGNDMSFIKAGARIIHWVGPENIPTRVLMPDGSILEGVSEAGAADADQSIIQFERLGFCKLTLKDGAIEGIFTHK